MDSGFLASVIFLRKRAKQSRPGALNKVGQGRRLVCEMLEDRRLLSIGPEPVACQLLASSSVAQTVWFDEAASTEQSELDLDVASLELSDYDASGISGRLTVPGILYETVSTTDADFTRLAIPGWSTSYEIGRPELPVFRASVVIPAGMDVASVDLTTSGVLHLATEDPVFPTQPLTPDLIGWEETEEASIFWYDTDYYLEGDGAEAKLFWASEPLIAGDNYSVALEFYPFQYDAATGNVSVVTDIEFELAFSESTTPEAVLEYEGDLVSAAAEADYLIITADAYYEEILPLAEWKYRKGYKTYVAKMSEVGTTEEDVYNYLKAAYDADADKPEYVLLVGDHEDIPSCEIIGHPYYSDTYVWYADYDYTRLSGSDVLADVALGRLSADSEAQVTTMVNKILTYEITPDTSDRYDDILLAGMFQDSNDGVHDLVADRFFMEDLHRITDFLSGDYDFWSDPDPYDKGFTVYTKRVWQSSTSEELHYRASSYPGRITPPNPLPDSWKFKSDVEIAPTINNGVGIVLHRDHGSSGGWGTPGFSTSSVNALTNGNKLPVVFSLNCGTGQFDGTDAFAEAWLRNANGGAVAMTGAARVSYSGPNDCLHVGIFDSMWNDYDTNWTSSHYARSWHYGQLMNYAKDRVFTGYGYSTTTNALLTARLYNVFGDPELMIRTETPTELSVSHPAAVGMNTATNFAVEVTKDGVPVEGALVAISCSTGDDYWVGETNGAGQVTFVGLTALEAGTYDIVVSERNAFPYQGTFESYAIPGIDLIGTDFDVTPDNLLLGAGVATADFSLLNIGDTNATAFDIQFYLSDDAHIDPTTDVLLQLDLSDPSYDASEPEAYHVSSLASLAVHAGSVILVVPASDPFGTDNDYYIGMFVDADADLSEANESNNHSQGQDLDYDNVDFTLGPLDHFAWDTISSPKFVDVPFPVTITAVDSNGLTITDFDDTVDLAAYTGGTGVLYSTDFENNDGGWVASATWDATGDWEWGAPTSGPGEAYSGQNVWATVLDGDYTDANGSSYLSQTFDFTGCSGTTLTWHEWNYVRYMGDMSRVYVNDDMVYSRHDFYPTSDYEEVVVDLSAYDNLDSVEIVFELYADTYFDRPGWYIDDIVISSDATSIPISPSATANFVNGAWTGDVTVLAVADEVCLRANDNSGYTGVSDTFDVFLHTQDFGDAPTAAQSGFAASYPTALPDGARHTAAGPTLGANRDTEADGQPSAGATGDDINDTSDEDGIAFVTATLWTSGTEINSTASVDVDLRGADANSNRLDAWIDFNHDGDWDDPGEQIFTNHDLGTTDGVQTLVFSIPQDMGDNVILGDTYARFRLSTTGGLAPTGSADDGEVEDHLVTIALPAPVLDPEPLTTSGTENTVSWSTIVGASEYYVECDNDPLFDSPEHASGWITDTHHTFIELPHGETYYYRVKARSGSPNFLEGPWSDAVFSTQDDQRPSVVHVIPSDMMLTNEDAGGTFTLEVRFNDSMDTSAEPLLTFIPSHEGTLVNGWGEWSQFVHPNDTFTMTYNVVNVGAVVSTVGVDVTGTKDAAGNIQYDYVPRSEFVINMSTSNQAPTDISLAEDNIDENEPAGTVVGTLSTTDPDPGDAFTYTLVAGEGDADNGSFTIDGDLLKTAAVFNHEMKDSFSIRVKTTDSGGMTFEKVFVIAVNDVSEVMLPGDANDDHVVNSLDGQIVSANWGTTSGATWRMGDFNHDNAVNATDASIMAAHWGATLDTPLEPDVPTQTENDVLIGPLEAKQTNMTRRVLQCISRNGSDLPLLESLPEPFVKQQLAQSEAASQVPDDNSVDLVSESSLNDDELVGDSVFESSLDDDGLVGESVSQAETKASDVVIARQYGPRQDERLGLERQRLAWSYTHARRNSDLREDRSPLVNPLAVEIFFAEE